MGKNSLSMAREVARSEFPALHSHLPSSLPCKLDTFRLQSSPASSLPRSAYSPGCRDIWVPYGELHSQPVLVPVPLLKQGSTASFPSNPSRTVGPVSGPPRCTTVTMVTAVVVVNSPSTTAPTSHCQAPASRASSPLMTSPHCLGPAPGEEESLPSSHTRPPPTV